MVALVAFTFFSVAKGEPGYYFGQLEMERAWGITRGGPQVKVALISSGVNYRLPGIVDSIAKNPGESGNGRESDGIDNDGNGYVDDVFGVNTRLATGDPMDTNDVGTYEASIIASTGYGLAPGVKIIPISVFDSKGAASWIDVMRAIQYAKSRGASVIYLGVGGTGADPGTQTRLCNTLRQSEVTVIAAAGNEAKNLSSSASWRFPTDCRASNQITVASSAEDSSLATFSNFGFDRVHLGAPGEGVVGLDRYGREKQIVSSTVSASLTTGAAALVMSAHPNYTSYHVKEALMRGTDLFPGLAGKVMSGGRLNVYKSLTANIP